MNLPLIQSRVPSVSVVLCTYNGSQFLREQLATIAAQTLAPAELVVCDDGSTDDTMAILEEFEASASFPVRIIRNASRLGSTGNFDKAISLACGEFTALCDQDDRWAPNKLERLAEILRQNLFLGGVFSDADLIDESSHPVGTRLFAQRKFTADKQSDFLSDPISMLMKHDVVTGATLLFRTSMRKYFQPIPSSWVHDGWITWMISLYSQLEFTTEPLTAYRIHPSQQLGVNASNAAPGSSSYETRRQHCARVARQFEDLLNRLLDEGFGQRSGIILAIRHKIGFLRGESRLSPWLAIRLLQILRLLPDYRTYARGLGSLRRDLLLRREAL